MLVFAVAVVLVYAVFLSITSVRLILLARQTKALPEAVLGVSYILAGVLGWAAVLLGGAFASGAPSLARILNAVGLLSFSAGTLGIGLFCWRVFAPKSRTLSALFWLLAATLVVDYVHNIVLTGVPFPPTSSPWYWPGMVARTTLYGWPPFLALPYYARLRRRLSLGLADPVATNRVFLFGVGGAITFTSSLFVVAVTLADLWSTPARSPIAIVTVLAAAADALLTWLAFAPPKTYVAWVKARALDAVAA